MTPCFAGDTFFAGSAITLDNLLIQHAGDVVMNGNCLSVDANNSLVSFNR